MSGDDGVHRQAGLSLLIKRSNSKPTMAAIHPRVAPASMSALWVRVATETTLAPPSTCRTSRKSMIVLAPLLGNPENEAEFGHREM